MTSPTVNTAHILNAYRQSDAVIIVCQNNTKKIIEIAAINDEAARVMGYSNDELVHGPLAKILPERLVSTVEEFVEYEEEQSDLLAVLNKIRNFSVKSRAGKELNFHLRVIRGEPIDHNPWFHLVLVDEEKLRKSNAFRVMLKENFKGHEVVDEDTRLPNRASLVKDLELVTYHARSKELSASFAVMEINRYNQLFAEHGKVICNQLHQHLGQICKQKLRAEDTLGTLSPSSLGIILIDASQEVARMVLNRLRWVISVTPLQLPGGKELLAQVNINFTEVDGRASEADLVGKCEGSLDALRHTVNNSVQLVVAHDRRERTERRVPPPQEVLVDRRIRKDRRKD